MSLRQAIGLLALPIPFVAGYIIGTQPNVGETSRVATSVMVLVNLISYIWIVLSLSLKISMVLNKYWLKLNALSSILWMACMFFGILFVPPNPNAVQYTTTQSLAGISFLFGWFAIDLADKFYMIKRIGVDNL